LGEELFALVFFDSMLSALCYERYVFPNVLTPAVIRFGSPLPDMVKIGITYDNAVFTSFNLRLFLYVPEHIEV
jgi:hypothetical protein